VLNAAAQAQVKAMFEAAGDAMANGGLEAGVAEMNKITDELNKIKAATDPIQEIIDTNGLSEYELAIRSINKEFDSYASALEDAGVDLSKYTQLEEARTIALNNAAESTSRLTEEAQKYADATATAEDNLRSAYERESAVFQSTIDQFTQFGTELRKFKDSLLLGNLSTLSPEAKYAEAKRQYEAIANRAQLGDADAIAQLQGVSQSFLDASRGYYASTAQYASDFAMVSAALDSTASVADRTASIAKQQLSALTSQVSALITINQSVLSVRDAISALNAAKAAEIMAPSSPAGVFYGSPNGAAATSIADLYTINLGRAPDAAGLAYWSAQFGDTISAAEAQQFAMAAVPEYLQTHSFASGGDHYGGLRLVGERGPELEVTGPARIYNASQTRQMLAGGSDEETKVLLKEILAELKADKSQRGAVGVATLEKFDEVVDRLDKQTRTLDRRAA
jgi:uncharacterized protein YukE